MPHPDGEVVRVAVEKALHEGLADMGGDWIGVLPNGTELEFRPGREGTIVLDHCLPDEELEGLPDDAPAEKTYRFRIRVELVP